MLKYSWPSHTFLFSKAVSILVKKLKLLHQSVKDSSLPCSRSLMGINQRTQRASTTSFSSWRATLVRGEAPPLTSLTSTIRSSSRFYLEWLRRPSLSILSKRAQTRSHFSHLPNIGNCSKVRLEWSRRSVCPWQDNSQLNGTSSW